MKIKIFDSGKSVSVGIREVKSWEFGLGLMFRTRNTKNLLFDFRRKCKVKFTGVFVFFPFLILFLDEKNKVVDKKIAKPFEFSIVSKKSFTKVVEVPVNEKNSKILDFFDDKRRKV